ncbi:MAG TPA: hypothetical protein VNW92_17440 [Polyangiaceae bacterium]|nr:hypothetical protein [Polyangiaceae bacterium]
MFTPQIQRSNLGESGTSFGMIRPQVTLLVALLSGAGQLGCASSPPSPPAWPAAPVTASEPVRLDASKGSMSEGLALHERTAYVGYAGTGEIDTINLDTGAIAPYSALPKPVAGKGFVTGLAYQGNSLFGALVSFVPDVQAGVYRVDAAGAAVLFAKHPEMAFPNGLLFDDAGRLYVTDSAAGAIFRVDPTGDVSKWLASDLLVGGKDSCGAGNGVGVPFDIGANGIVSSGGSLYITNTDKATIVRIPIAADGSAGTPVMFVGPSCADLSGADGLTLAPNGDLVVAVNHLNKLVRVDTKGNLSTLVAGDPLDFPTSLVFSEGALYVGNFAFLDAKNPGLIRIP